MAKRKIESELADPESPSMCSVEWQDYCMGLFNDDEMRDGCPTVAGLRRVSELVIGPIVDMQPVCVEGPCEGNGWSAAETIRIGFASRDLGRDVYFSGEADCIPGEEGNCEAAYARFPTAMAGTRARARAFRNALRLNKVAAEECTSLPVVERTRHQPPGEEMIAAHQVTGITKTCRDLDIDPIKLINQFGSNYSDLKEMTKKGAAKAGALLNKYFQGSEAIPESILTPEGRAKQK